MITITTKYYKMQPSRVKLDKLCVSVRARASTCTFGKSEGDVESQLILGIHRLIHER